MPTAIEKTDFHKTHKSEYAKPKQPAIVDVASARYLAIEGQGRPGNEAFQAQIGALYQAAWTIKMTKKFAGEGDFKVCSLEALYWSPDGKAGAEWCWMLMIRIPEFVLATDLKAALADLKKKGKDTGPEGLHIEKLKEGRSVQMLHVGPYDSVGTSIEKMQAFAAEKSLAFHDRHHEIYLSDPRRVPPERLRTILRHPVK